MEMSAFGSESVRKLQQGVPLSSGASAAVETAGPGLLRSIVGPGLETWVDGSSSHASASSVWRIRDTC